MKPAFSPFSNRKIIAAFIALSFMASTAAAATMDQKDPRISSTHDRPEGFKTLALGDSAPDFSLLGADGKTYTLASFSGAKCLMVVFMSNHCPASHAAETRILPYAAAVKDKGVAVVAINPDSNNVKLWEMGWSKYEETYEGMKDYARDHQFNIPYLYDGETQAVGKAYGVLATPHVFIFDQERKLRYAGRFDDSRFPDPATVHSNDAANAVTALLEGKPVPVATTRPAGCSISWNSSKQQVLDFDAAWAKLPTSVEKIDSQGVAALAKNPTNKLRVINVWATWCVPCVEEFPALVKISRRLELRDFELITISIDDPKAEPKVQQFLARQHAATPPQILGTVEEEGRRTNNYLFTGSSDALAVALDKEWPGPVPYTIVVAPGGEILHRWNGQVDAYVLLGQLVDQLGTYTSGKTLHSK